MTGATTDVYDLEESHLIRQCRNWQVVNGLPTYKAFLFPDNKNTLSFSCLENICARLGVEPDFDAAIIELEKSPPLTPKRGFMWAVLSAEEIKTSVQNFTGRPPSMEPDSTDNDPAHVIVWGWKQCGEETEKEIAQDLAAKLTESNTRHWPVTPQNKPHF